MSDPNGLAIAGLVPLSTCDWPGRLVATVFLQGCPWNCVYCHNPDLIDPRAPGKVAWGEVTDLLDRRRGLLDAAVFTGGEPTRRDLTEALAQVRSMGFQVGLHTMGAYPKNLARILPLVDWVGFDVKALPERLEQVTGTAGSSARMVESLDLVVASGVDHQVRTTWGPGVMDLEAAEQVAAWARSRGARQAVLQPVRPEGTRPTFQATYRAASAA